MARPSTSTASKRSWRRRRSSDCCSTVAGQFSTFMRRVVRWAEWDESALCNAAACVGEGFRSLFNLPETISFLRADGDAPYWRLALQYGAVGNLSSVLDEYFHWLLESLGRSELDRSEERRVVNE